MPTQVEERTEQEAPKQPRSLGFQRRFGGMAYGQREIKMLMPLCDTCQAPGQWNPRWWRDCIAKGHDPYFSISTKLEREPVYTTDDQGRRVVESWRQVEVEVRTPNLTQISTSERIGNGQAVGIKRTAFGYILPSEHPTDPIKDMCEFRDCFADEIKVANVYGRFCSQDHYVSVKADADGVFIPVKGKQASDMGKFWRSLA